MKHHPLPDRNRKDKNTHNIFEWKRSEAKVRDQMLPTNYIEREAIYTDKYLKVNSIIFSNIESNDGQSMG